MQSANSRKGRTSITHLMQFALPPRPQNYQSHHHGRSARRNPTWGLGSGYHAADKARFVDSINQMCNVQISLRVARYIHANYRFIVIPNGDYRAQAMDADVHLDWSNVLQILVSAQSQSTNCPICLSHPVAPRMAKCGHIFCLPCLIRYMHSTDDTNVGPDKKPRWKKCPICWDSIYISETRPVRWFTGQEGERPQEGADVVLRLIMRQPGSTLALPRDGGQPLGSEEQIPWYFAAEVMDYARVMKGSKDYMLKQYDNEIVDVQEQEKEDELMFGEEIQWTRKAIHAIHEAKDKIKGLGNPPSAPQQPNERKSRRPPIQSHDDVPEHYMVQHAARSGQSIHVSHSIASQDSRSESMVEKSHVSSSTSHSEDRTSEPIISTESSLSSRSQSQTSALASAPPSHPPARRISGALHPHHNDQPYLFYEALLHYYLSPLDIRILKAAFGDFSSFPTTILPRVERVSNGHIVDDELRRRAKYFAHLPHGCEVGFLECDWTDVVAPEILEGFANEIDRRRKKNREKEVREEKERVRAERLEDDKKWATARRRRPTPSQDIISEEEFQPLPEPSATDLVAASSSPPWSMSRAQGGSSFASLASPSTSPVTAKTVWGTRIAIPPSPVIPASADEHDHTENDGWLQGWDQDLLQEEDFIAQVEASTLNESSSKPGPMMSQGKKKKGKKITLMSTNARRGA